MKKDPSPLTFLRRISKADDYDTQVRTLAKYFMEVVMLDERFLAYLPSKTTAACVYLARRMLNRSEWVTFEILTHRTLNADRYVTECQFGSLLTIRGE